MAHWLTGRCAVFFVCYFLFVALAKMQSAPRAPLLAAFICLYCRLDLRNWQSLVPFMKTQAVLGFPFSLNFSLYHLWNYGMADPGSSFGDRWALRFRAITAEPTHDFQPKQCRCAGWSACSHP